MQEKLGKIVHNGEIYDLDDISSIGKLESLLKKLESEEKSIKSEINNTIKSDLEETE